MIPRESERPIKIGITENLPARLDALQTSSPYLLALLGYWPARKGLETEREMHEKWNQYRLEGEWFFPAPDLIREVTRISDSFQDNVRKHWPTKKQAAFAQKNKGLAMLMGEAQSKAYQDWVNGYDLLAFRVNKAPDVTCDSCKEKPIDLRDIIRKEQSKKKCEELRAKITRELIPEKRAFLSPSEVEILLGVSSKYLERAVKMRQIPHLQLGKQYRAVQFHKEAFYKWVESEHFDSFVSIWQASINH